MKLVTVQEMRNLESRAAEKGLPSNVLMENAGKAIAREITKCFERIEGCPVLILIGPGNNGGDGLVTARYLHEWGADVKLYLCAERSSPDPNYILTQKRNISVTRVADDKGFTQLEQFLASSQIVIDALLGIGKSRLITGTLKEVITRVNEVKETNSHLTIFAVDIPSGLDSDTGYMDAAGIKADVTITLGCPKLGLLTFPGTKNAGKMVVADIGIPPELTQDINVEVITRHWIKSRLPQRPPDANKGTFGKVMVISGSLNYIGAPYFACSGAIRTGAGMVTLGIGASLQSILATKMAEVTYLPLPEQAYGIIGIKAVEIVKEQLSNYNVLLIGCGLGQNSSTIEFVRSLLTSITANTSQHVVIDADGLNALAQFPYWWKKIPDDAILTPHPGEMSKLTNQKTSIIQSRRLDTAREAAALWHKTVVLKGAYTIIASADGRVNINPVANAGLASAGTGDILSGIIASLLAQGMSSFEAASCGVFLHSIAGKMVKEELGDTGILASDLLPVLPLAIRLTRDEP